MKSPRKIRVTTRIKNGKFASNTDIISQILHSHEGNLIDVTFAKRTNKRSNRQNAYYWGVIIPIFIYNIKESWGEIWGAEQMHDFLKEKCNYREIINDTGEIIKVTKSTTENDTKQQEDFQERCRELSRQYFNSEIPLPNEEIEIGLE